MPLNCGFFISSKGNMMKSLRLVLSLGLAIAMAACLPAVASVDALDIGLNTKVVSIDKAYAHADVAVVATATQKIAGSDMHVDSRVKLRVLPEGDGHQDAAEVVADAGKFTLPNQRLNL
jgi:hypothetical protein